jgi:hypothetical protein
LTFHLSAARKNGGLLLLREKERMLGVWTDRGDPNRIRREGRQESPFSHHFSTDGSVAGE